VGDLSLDPARHRVFRGDEEVHLTPRQFALLEFMMRRGGEVVSKRVIIEHVWDFAFDGDPNIVEVYVANLRKRIDQPFGRASLQTVRGAGYRLDADEATR
jgi:DNA-binding response OmpR family regulator